MPNDFRVTISASDLLQYWVSVVFGVSAAIEAVCDALDCGIACCSVDEHLCGLAGFTQAAGVIPVHYSAATEHRPEFIRRKRLPQFRPVHKVAAYRVAPVHVSPVPTVRVMLEKKVI